MFWVYFAKFIEKAQRKEPEETMEKDEAYVVWPGIRRLIGSGIKILFFTGLASIVFIPTAHLSSPHYFLGIPFFWFTYISICGVFFCYRHFDEEGEGPYLMPFPIIMHAFSKIRDFLRDLNL